MIRRYWFIVVLAFLATITIIAAITAVTLRSKNDTQAIYDYDSVQTELSPSSYWIVVSGSIVVSHEHLVKLIVILTLLIAQPL